MSLHNDYCPVLRRKEHFSGNNKITSRLSCWGKEYTPKSSYYNGPISSGKCKRMFSDRSVVASGCGWVGSAGRDCKETSGNLGCDHDLIEELLHAYTCQNSYSKHATYCVPNISQESYCKMHAVGTLCDSLFWAALGKCKCFFPPFCLYNKAISLMLWWIAPS